MQHDIPTLKPAPAPSCADCAHGIWHDGYAATMEEPGDEGELECRHALACGIAEELEAWADAYDIAPGCPWFSPRMIAGCAHCGAKIAQEERRWTIYTYDPYSGEPVYACSQTCKAELDAKANEALARELDDEPF